MGIRRSLTYILTASLLVLFSVYVSAQASPRISITMEEDGKITNYFDDYFIVQVRGTVYFHNQLNTTLYNTMFPYDLGYLTIFETSETDHIEQNQIVLDEIEENEIIGIDYEIRGITLTDPLQNDQCILFNVMKTERPIISPYLISEIKKAEIENETISEDTYGIRKRRGRRLITVSLRNPAGLTFNITSIEVLKTNTMNLTDSNILNRWQFPEDGGIIRLEPFDSWTMDIIDLNSSDGEIYWLTNDLDIDSHPVFSSNHSIEWVYPPEFINVENNTLSEEESQFDNISFMERFMFFRKSVQKIEGQAGDLSKISFFLNDLVEIKLKVANFAPIARKVNVVDYIPSGFEIFNYSYSPQLTDSSIEWNEVMVPADKSMTFRYRLEYKDEESLGVDYFDQAVLKYENETMYSKRIPFIRRYIPEKKMFLQKVVTPLIDDEMKVKILVQNLGEGEVEDIYIKEFLGSTDDFREMTIQPNDMEKRVWKIEKLNSQQTWQVEYVTNENDRMYLFPQILGVEKNVVMKTMVFQPEVTIGHRIYDSIPVLAIVGVILIILFPITIFIMQRERRWKREYSLWMTLKSALKLKKDTEMEPKRNIDFLKNDSEKAGKFKKHRRFFSSDIPPPKKQSSGYSGRMTPKDIARANLEKLDEMMEENNKKRQQ